MLTFKLLAWMMQGSSSRPSWKLLDFNDLSVIVDRPMIQVNQDHFTIWCYSSTQLTVFQVVSLLRKLKLNNFLTWQTV
jgi:hypothetical protein